MSAERKVRQQAEAVTLTTRELDDRLDAVMHRVAGEAGAVGDPAEDWRPRWITACDLVRRVRPYIVYN